jgi:hypothetical protein
MNTVIPTIDRIKSLDGRIVAMLTPEESEVLDFYRAQGRKFDVSVSIIDQADPDELARSSSEAQADEIMKRANSVVSITVGAGSEMRWLRASQLARPSERVVMRTIELGLPAVFMLLISAWSGYGMLAVMSWTAVGLIIFKAAALRIRLSDDGLDSAWKQGWRRVLLAAHRVWYWPYYLWVERFAGR